MKTLFFYGVSALGFNCSLMLIDPNISCKVNYSYGALVITFDLKYRKEIGLALKKTFKRKDFRQTLNP